MLVTPEKQPLQIFEREGSDAVRRQLEERSIAVLTGSSPVGYAQGVLRLALGGAIETDRVITVPRLRGLPLEGLPATLDGFIPIDAHGRVAGCADVYAAGDITDFPVKQGGISAQLADTAAVAIAGLVGAKVEPRPFRPVLRALLLTGTEALYLRRELPGACRVASIAAGPPWSLPAKIRARYLTPFLTRAVGASSRR